MDTTIHIANDNGPLPGASNDDLLSQGDTIGRQMAVQNHVNTITSHETPKQPKAHFFSSSGITVTNNKSQHLNKRTNQTHRISKNKSPVLFFMSFCLWLTIAAGTFVYAQTTPNPVISILSYIGVGWASLWLAYISQLQERDFFRDLGLSAMLASLGGAVFIASNSYNITLNIFMLCGGTAFLTAFLSYLLKQRYFLTVSAMAALSWSVLSLSQMQITALYWTFPALWFVQMSLCIEFRARLPLTLTTLSGFVWLIAHLLILILSAKISILMAICVLFTVGMTYARISAILQENNILNGSFQTNFGWVLAMFTALILQDYWLVHTKYMPWTKISTLAANQYPFVTQWGLVISACALTLIMCAFLMRSYTKHPFVSKFGYITFTLFVPLSIALNNHILKWYDEHPDIPVSSFGTLIGVGITMIALHKLSNGVQNKHKITIFLALLVLCTEVVLMFDRLLDNPDNVIIFVCCILITALTSAVFGKRNAFSQNIIHENSHA